ncbi:hypothetical protein SAMN05216489_02143 [Streptomyces sp. 3213]|nr:hypothetical protein SAMN05216489_02143 [Streptomyces sp. 3213] [Streptomyces sp. 3213.3]
MRVGRRAGLCGPAGRGQAGLYELVGPRPAGLWVGRPATGGLVGRPARDRRACVGRSVEDRQACTSWSAHDRRACAGQSVGRGSVEDRQTGRPTPGRLVRVGRPTTGGLACVSRSVGRRSRTGRLVGQRQASLYELVGPRPAGLRGSVGRSGVGRGQAGRAANATQASTSRSADGTRACSDRPADGRWGFTCRSAGDGRALADWLADGQQALAPRSARDRIRLPGRRTQRAQVTARPCLQLRYGGAGPCVAGWQPAGLYELVGRRQVRRFAGQAPGDGRALMDWPADGPPGSACDRIQLLGRRAQRPQVAAGRCL